MTVDFATQGRTLRRPVLGLEFISGERWTGGAIYLRNLVYCLASLPAEDWPEVRILGAVDPDDATIRTLASLPFVNLPVTAAGPAPGSLSVLWSRIKRRFFSRHASQDAEYLGVEAVYPGFGPKLPGAARIHWIPDLQHVHLPEMFDSRELAARDASMSQVAQGDGVLVLSSNSTRHDFDSNYPHATVAIRIWRFCSVLTENEMNGADPHARYALPDKYLYLPNQFWKHKNHITVFRALRRLRERGQKIPLVCTGLEDDSRHPGHTQFLRDFLSEQELNDQVYMLGLVPRADQIQIFRHAAAVIQPSLFEGWSTVVEDTKTIGRPLYLSDLPVHREQLADGPFERFAFFATQDDAGLAEIIAREWDSLEPGPDPQAEARAAERAHRVRLQAARDFLAIVNEAIALEHRRPQEGAQ